MPKTRFVCFELTVGILTTSKMSLRIDFQNKLKLKDFELQLGCLLSNCLFISEIKVFIFVFIFRFFENSLFFRLNVESFERRKC